MIRTRNRLLLVAGVMILGPTNCMAALLISNIKLTPSSLSFDVRGTVDVVGNSSNRSLYFGEPLNNTWIVGGTFTQFGLITVGDWTYHSGSFRTSGGAVYHYNGPPSGDYVYSNKMARQPIVVGDTVDMSFSVVRDEAFLIPANTDVSKWIVSAGYNFDAVMLPDPRAKTGYAIPEPTALALAAMLAGCGMMGRRRVA